MEALSILLSWPAVVLAGATGFVLEGLKRAIDLVWKGRRDAKWFCDLLMPWVIAPAIGYLLGVAIPYRPELLVEMVGADPNPWIAFGPWGAVVGAFGGEWGYRRLKKLWPKG